MLVYLIYLIIGIAIGAAAGILWGNSKAAAARSALSLVKAEAEAERTRALSESNSRIHTLSAEVDMLQARLKDDREAHARDCSSATI